MDFQKYITEQALILIPVLYIIGMIFKSSSIPNKYIPIILTVIGVALAIMVIGPGVQAVIQGILVAGASVFVNETITQLKKDE